MSRSKKSSDHRPGRPTFAIVLLVGFIAAVFAFIGFRQIRSAEERRLRLLAGFSDRVETTVPDLADRFGRIVSERCARRVEQYLALVPHVEHLESSPVPVECPERQGTGAGADGSEGDGEPRGKVELLTEGSHVRLVYTRNDEEEVSEGDEAAEGEEGVDQGAGSPESNDESEEALAEGLAESARARIDLERVIEPMVIPGVFDSLLITDSRGVVLHQHGDPELKVTDLGTLLGVEESSGEPGEIASWRAVVRQEGGSAGRFFLRLLENEPPEPPPSAGEATAILKTQIADSDYSVFLQPVTLDLDPLEGQEAPPTVPWVAVGIISSEHLLSAGVTTSPILLFLLVSILPVGLVAWPFLKLFLISRRQPFTRFDCAFLILAAVLGLSFLALFLFDGLFLANSRETVDRQLADLSEEVSRSFRLEILDAYDQLEAKDQDVEFDDLRELDFFDYLASPAAGREAGDRGVASDCSFEDGIAAAFEQDPERVAECFVETRVASHFQREGSGIYPYFDSIFWPDRNGHLRGANLPLRRHAVLPQRVGDRAYFRCARDREDLISLWYGPDELGNRRSIRAGGGEVAEKLATERTIELCLQPLLDRTTGEAVAALSFPSSSSDRGGEDRPVAALVTQLTSLHHPVLPPEIGFAVVETSGRVMFHSDTRRALTENFLKASDENRLLHALLETRRAGPLSLHYWGRRHRAHVRPIDGLPWSLVTFRNMEDVRLRNFELIYDFLNPFLLSLGLLALLAAAFKWIAPRHFKGYLWPTSRSLAAYRRLVLWTLGVLAVFLVLLVADGLSPTCLFVASFLVAPTTFAVIVFLLPWLHRKRPSSGPSRFSRLWDGRRAAAPGAPVDEEDGSPEVAAWRRRRRWTLKAFASVLGLVVIWALVAGLDVMVVFVAGVLGAIGYGYAWFRHEFEGHSRRKIAYLFALGCVLLLSLLPSLGFLHLARSRQVQFLAQDAELALSHRIAERREELENRRGPILGPIAGFYDGYDDVLACTREGYLFAVFATETVDPAAHGLPPCPGESDGPALPSEWDPRLWPYGGEPENGPGTRLRRWMMRTLSSRLLPLNDLSPRPVGVDLSRFDAATDRWSWSEGESGRGRIFLEAPRDFGAGVPVALVSTVPETGSLIGLPLSTAGLVVLGLVLLATAPFLLARFIAERLLLISLVYYGRVRPNRERAASERSPAARPMESVAAILDEARSKPGAVKRLVLVSGQFERGAWKYVTGQVEEGEDDLARSDYWETSFRKAWEIASAEGRGEGSQPDETSGEDVDGAAPPATEGGSAPPSRAQRFADELFRGAGPKQPLLITDFDPDENDPKVAADQTDALRHLIESLERSVVILSDVVPLRGEERDDAGVIEARKRWSDLLGAFPVRYARDTRGLQTFRRWVRRCTDEGLTRLVEGSGPPRSADLDHWRRLVELVGEECEHTLTLREVGRQLLDELVETLDEEAEAESDSRTSPEQTEYLTLLTGEHVISRVGAEARLHYRYLWSQCTTDEKLVLVQLAQHGLVNPKYFGWVLDLMNRGLVVRAPDLRLMNESFRRFVDQEVRRSDVLEWEEELGPSAWGVLKWILPFPLLALAGFLFITQRDAVSNVAGVLVALASLTPVVFNLYDKFQQVNLRGSRAGAGGGSDADDE